MEPLLSRWKALAPRTRVLAVGLSLALIGAIFIGMLTQRDTRIALFASPLTGDQVDEVVAQLAAWRAAFVAGSDNVRVDPRDRDALLLRLALSAVPHRHLASVDERLAKVGPLTPQSVLDAQQLDGLAGELARGLRGLAGVDDAEVIIAPAMIPTFADDTGHPATASVRIRLRSGATLLRETVDGIREFVAAGVPGLEPQRVAILDDRGLALAGERANGSDGTLAQSLQSALDAAVGAGATIVRVHVERDPRSHDLTHTRRAPLAAGAIAATNSSERYHDAKKSYAKSSATSDRGSQSDDERSHVPAGAIARISAAVMVDSRRGFDLAKIAAIAGATLGLVPARGDSLRIEAIAFGSALPRPGSTRAMIVGLIAALAPQLALAAAALIAIRWWARPVAALVERGLQRAAVARTSREVAGYPPAVVRGALRGEPPHTAAAIISALPTATATAVLELYPPDERAAIVRRMARTTASVVPDCESLLRRA